MLSGGGLKRPSYCRTVVRPSTTPTPTTLF